MSRGAFCGSVRYLTISPFTLPVDVFDVGKISRSIRARVHWPDVIDLAPGRRPSLSLRTRNLNVDDLRIDLPFFGLKAAKLGVVLLTSADFVTDVCDLAALAFHLGDGRATVLLRLPFYAPILKRPPVNPGVVAVPLKMAVGQLLP
jgi:hypothetical protein